MVTFDPPNDAARFRAYDSLDQGACAWVKKHQAIAADNPGYLTAINNGDTSTVASTLKSEHYYTGPEAAYSRNMGSNLKKLNTELGPAR